MVVSLVSFTATGVMSLARHARKGKGSREQLAYQQMIWEGRETVNRMVQEVGQAGTPSASHGEPEAGLTAANSNRVAATQFLVATPTQLIFEADLDQDGTVERVEYRLNGEALERSVVPKYPEGGAPPAQYKTLVSNVDNGALPLFSYPGDPFAAPLGDADSGAVRILLLLRAPSKSEKQPYQTVGFEGVARRQLPVAARPVHNPEQSGLSADPTRDSRLAADYPPIQETYARKWTLR